MSVSLHRLSSPSFPPSLPPSLSPSSPSLPPSLPPSLHISQEGAQLLEGEQFEKTRSQTAASNKEPKSPTTPNRSKRTTTIVQTTEVTYIDIPLVTD